jgi:hypothetical protein
MLEAEVRRDRLCNAQRYERTEARREAVPATMSATRRESSVEEAMIEMYVAGRHAVYK